MIILKNFQIYDSKTLGSLSVLYLKDETGADWYASQKLFSATTLKFVFNSAGIVISMSYDVSKLWPVGHSVAEISASDVPADLDIAGNWVFDGKKIIARAYTAAERVDQATVNRENLLAYAAQKIAPLQDAVDIDEATDTERENLTAWKKYRVALNRLDVSAAPDITWPELPA